MKRFVLLAPVMACLLSCATEANLARSWYAGYKLSQASTKGNAELFRDCGFRSYISYKTTLRSDFDVLYFRSIDYHYQYSSRYSVSRTDYVVNSSLILPGRNTISLGNLFSDYLSRQNGRATLRFYLLEDEKLISKRLILELGIPSSLLETPGRLKSRDDKDAIVLSIRSRDDAILYSLAVSDADSLAELETMAPEGGVVWATLSASLKSATGDSYYNIKDGRFWIKP